MSPRVGAPDRPATLARVDRVARLLAATALVAIAGCGAGHERAPPARAWTDPGEVTAGEWTLYYNALPATDLDPAMAKAYGVALQPRGALVTVSLVRAGDPHAAADASVEIEARTLLGQSRPVAVRRVTSAGVVSWLGELEAGAHEQLTFSVRARLPGTPAPLVAEFRREFHAS